MEIKNFKVAYVWAVNSISKEIEDSLRNEGIEEVVIVPLPVDHTSAFRRVREVAQMRPHGVTSTFVLVISELARETALAMAVIGEATAIAPMFAIGIDGTIYGDVGKHLT